MYHFCYNYAKPKYGDKVKLFYLDTNSFIVHKKHMLVIKILQKMLKLDLIFSVMNQIGSYQKAQKKKVIWLMKHELERKIMTKVVGLGAKTYSYLIDDGSEDKKTKSTKKCVIKRKPKSVQNYKNCSEVTQFQNKIKDLDLTESWKNHEEFISSERHNIFTK